jgi:hypothetical protein
VVRRKITREIERDCFERFRQAYALPAGCISYGDKPDVTLIGDRTIGIEITRFYLGAVFPADPGRQLQTLGRVTLTADGCMMSVVCDGRKDAASDPSRIGSDQVRGVRFEGDRMVLIPPPRRRTGEIEEHREITWERIAAE